MRLSTSAAFCAVVCALSILISVSDAVNPDPRTLVIVDDPLIRSTHSQLFDSLKARRHKLSFVHPEDKPVLVQYGKFNYENLIVINSASDDVGVTTEDLMDFVDSGRNVLVLTNANVSEAVREFANECGVDFDDSGSSVVDHFQFDTNLDSGLHTVITTDKVIKNSAFVGKGPSAPVLFSGVGQAINKNSPYVTAILTGSKTTYSSSPLSRVGADVQGTGLDTVLLSAVQMANNARVVFSGCVDAFSNAYLASAVTTQTAKYDRSGNDELISELVKWNLGERSVLRATNLSHVSVRKPSEKNPFTYRIGDFTDFSIDIQEYDGVKGDWIAFTKSDVQLELVMMDPYYRSALKHNGRGLYTSKFQVPDNPGVFKFVINYRKSGFSNLQVEEQIAVRPYRHDEFERFLPAAYPYYMSAFSMMAGFFIFSLYFLYGKEK